MEDMIEEAENDRTPFWGRSVGFQGKVLEVGGKKKQKLKEDVL